MGDKMKKETVIIVVMSVMFVLPAIVMAYIELFGVGEFTGKQWFIASMMLIIAIYSNTMISVMSAE